MYHPFRSLRLNWKPAENARENAKLASCPKYDEKKINIVMTWQVKFPAYLINKLYNHMQTNNDHTEVAYRTNCEDNW